MGLYEKGGAQGLAAYLIHQAIKYAKGDAPSEQHVSERRQQEKDIRWLLNPAKSALWFEILGLDWEEAIQALREQGVFDGWETTDDGSDLST